MDVQSRLKSQVSGVCVCDSNGEQSFQERDEKGREIQTMEAVSVKRRNLAISCTLRTRWPNMLQKQGNNSGRSFSRALVGSAISLYSNFASEELEPSLRKYRYACRCCNRPIIA